MNAGEWREMLRVRGLVSDCRVRGLRGASLGPHTWTQHGQVREYVKKHLYTLPEFDTIQNNWP